MDGCSAADVARREMPDLIVLDIGLPRKDGHAVVRELRSSVETGYIPIIYLSAHASETDYRKAIQGRIERYITKPFSTQELMVAVEELVCTAGSSSY
jgi:two-component system alkaline phosphatase synthesis response regulator PhoP